MLNDELDIIKDVIVENSKDIYKDGLQETVKETSGALSAIVGLFNNIILFPVKKANISYKYKLECFERDLKRKTDSIPPDKLIEPPLMIAGPTLEALKYTYDEKELREMFVNLLASSMNSDKLAAAHPSYVDIIKQMSPLDATIFKEIVKSNQLMCGEVTFVIKGTKTVYILGMPKNFVAEFYNLSEPFLTSAILTNLERLGLIEITESGINGADYNTIKEHEFVKQQLKKFLALGKEIEVKVSGHAIRINNFGRNFASTCL